ncbi:hypothetical protein A4X09_0g4770 [Tilletia walkeri]|uniref:Uncharacterized protein n=1 Tax=Tilletia walkeri TaxID=117179 RepID=A0A8X7N6M0_9BASI|nr:hypothetical protein A4X09_0g4770 [Tilletia walkeri]
MKVSAQTPVVLAALSVAGSLASHVDNMDKRQLTGLPFVVSGSDQLTAEQKDALATLTKGLNGAASPLTNMPSTPPNPASGLPVGVGASNLPNLPVPMPQLGNTDPNTVAMLIQQNQQILSMLSAYLPPQAAAAMPNLGGMTGQVPTGVVMNQVQQLQKGAGQVVPAGLNGFPTLPFNMPSLPNQDPWHLANQVVQPDSSNSRQSNSQSQDPSFSNGHPWAQANNMIQGQLANKMPLSTDGFTKAQLDNLPKGVDPSQLSQNLNWAQAGRLANSLPGGQLMQNLPVSQATGYVDGIANGQLGQNLPFGQAAGLVNGVAGGQLGQNLPFNQATGMVNGIAGGQNLPLSQASGAINGLAGGQLGQLGQNLPISQAGGVINGVTSGQLGQGLPLSQAGGLVNGVPLAQAGGLVNGVTNGQLPAGLPLPLPLPGGGNGGGLLGGLLGPLNLQQHNGDHKGNKHHADDAVRTGTDLLATATAYVAGGPTGALGVPFKPIAKGGHQLNENVTDTSSMSEYTATTISAPRSSASGSTTTTTTTWSAPSLVRTSSYPSTIVPPATSTAVAYSATSASSSWSATASATSIAEASTTTSTFTSASASASASAGSTDDGELNIRPQRREWTWVAPRNNNEGGRFLPREAPAMNANELVAAKANLDPLLTNLLPNGPRPTSMRGSSGKKNSNNGGGPGRARMEMKKGKTAKGKEAAAYDDAKDALIKAEASLWEAEHPEGLAIDVNNTADKKGNNNKKQWKNSPPWAWIGSGSGEQQQQMAGSEEDDGQTKEVKGKKGKKKGSSAMMMSSTEAGPSFIFPASLSKPAAISASVTVSAPIRPSLKANLFN